MAQSGQNNHNPKKQIRQTKIQQQYAQPFFNFQNFYEQLFEDNDDSKDLKIESEKSESSENLSPEASDSSIGKLQKKKRNRKKSAYHNFQKHLVTTVRRHLKTRILKKRGDAPQIVLQMWGLFMKEKVYTKQFLLLVIGQYQNSDKEKYFSMLRKYKLFPFYEKYEAKEFEEAQKYLKERVMQALNSLDDRKILYKRRLQKQKQFVNYLREFVSDLQRQIKIRVTVETFAQQIKQYKIEPNLRQTSFFQGFQMESQLIQ